MSNIQNLCDRGYNSGIDRSIILAYLLICLLQSFIFDRLAKTRSILGENDIWQFRHLNIRIMSSCPSPCWLLSFLFLPSPPVFTFDLADFAPPCKGFDCCTSIFVKTWLRTSAAVKLFSVIRSSSSYFDNFMVEHIVELSSKTPKLFDYHQTKLFCLQRRRDRKLDLHHRSTVWSEPSVDDLALGSNWVPLQSPIARFWCQADKF